jgi:excisionase family DNA binding protein
MDGTMILDVDQAAALLRCAPDTVREQADRGVLPGVKYGRDWVFPEAALADALNDQARAQAASRRSRKQRPAAIVQPVPRREPPALPTVERPNPRRAATRTAPPLPAMTNP